MMSLDTVHDWLLEATDFDADKIIRENGLGPIPSDDFITFCLVSVTLPDYSFESKTEIDETTFTRGIHTSANVTIGINVYAKNGFSVLSSLQQSKHKFEVAEIFRSANVSLIKANGIRDLTQIGDTVHQYRYQMDFVFTCEVKSEFIEDRITQYLITGEWGNEDLTIDVPEQ